MLRERITDLLQKYEHSHPVADYTIEGRHMWPLLRNAVALQAYADSTASSSHPARTSPLTAVRQATGHALRAGAELLNRPRSRPRPADVVILTQGNRVQPLGQQRYHSFAAPLIDLLRPFERSFDVWQFGHPGLAVVPESMTMGYRWAFLHRAQTRHYASDIRPDWHTEFCKWADEQKLNWSCEKGQALLRAQLGAVEAWRWYLTRARCRLLLIDAWYDPPTNPALLAASELGITTVDIQHGLQGQRHFAYSGWNMPPDGHPATPDYYWVWGERDSQSLLRNNLGLSPERVLAAGNPWLNMWRTDTVAATRDQVRLAQKQGAGATKVCLVTLQPGVCWRPFLESMIRQAPSDWLWLIRMHRRMQSSPREVELSLKAAGHSNVAVEQPTTQALYALLRACDWHVTWSSTCAMEALAFGKPTMLLDNFGAVAYADFVAQGLMFAADDEAHAVRLIQTAQPPSAALKAAGCVVFAEPGAAGDAMRRLLTAAGLL